MAVRKPGCPAPAVNITSVNPPCPRNRNLPTDVRPLLAEARKRLEAADAYNNKVKGYAQQNMLPVDLEHMMSSEAAELTMRARAIERLSPTDAVALQLRNRADEMLRAGRTLRIEQSMNSKTPTEGYLDYLLEQQVVDIRKEGGLRDLGKRPDGRRDFLQEYEVRDLRSEPAQTLWYAHFHYTSAKPPIQRLRQRPSETAGTTQPGPAMAEGRGRQWRYGRGDLARRHRQTAGQQTLFHAVT